MTTTTAARLASKTQLVPLNDPRAAVLWLELCDRLLATGYWVDQESDLQLMLPELCVRMGVECHPNWRGWYVGIREK